MTNATTLRATPYGSPPRDMTPAQEAVWYCRGRGGNPEANECRYWDERAMACIPYLTAEREQAWKERDLDRYRHMQRLIEGCHAAKPV